MTLSGWVVTALNSLMSNEEVLLERRHGREYSTQLLKYSLFQIQILKNRFEHIIDPLSSAFSDQW